MALARRVLQWLTALALAGTLVHGALWVASVAVGCVPAADRPAVGFVVQTTPDDGCGNWRMHKWVTGHSALLLAATTVAGAGALRSPRAQRSAGALLLAATLIGTPYAAFLSLWNLHCGPVASYAGSCVAPMWIYAPVFALALTLAIVLVAVGSLAREA